LSLRDLEEMMAERCRPSFFCNHIDGDACMAPTLDLATFIQIDLGVGAFHE